MYGNLYYITAYVVEKALNGEMCAPMAKAYRLEKLDICRHLNAMEVQQVNKISTKAFFAKGSYITSADSQAREVYVLIEGQVDILSPNGISLYRVQSGEMFGELAVAPGVKRSASAVARDDCWVLVLSINHLEALGEESPEVYRKVSQNIVQSLGVKLARANKLIELLKSELNKALSGR